MTGNGGHRRHPGKTLGYEEDILIPLIVRGPSVPKGVVDTTSVYSLVDLSATILELAGAKAEYTIDGSIMPLTHELRAKALAEGGTKQHYLSEYFSEGVQEGIYKSHERKLNQTYRVVRVVEGEGDDKVDLAYSVWCTGEHELYDMTTDADQMHNLLLPETAVPAHIDLPRLANRLDALLLVLKSCVGEVCHEPWASVFPGGGVTSLASALQADFDSYFVELPKVTYKDCDLGFHTAREFPYWEPALAFGAAEPKLVIQAREEL